MNARRALRASLRARRRALSTSERAAMAEALAARLAGSLRIRRARRIAGYLCNDGEMDPGPGLALLRAGGAEVLLPVLRGAALWFLPYARDTTLAPNRFGIPEPAVGARSRCRAQDLDVVLMPLVAFDGAGNRLGMGGGFYDRTFAYLKHRRIWRKPLLMGVAYEFQRQEALPASSWDVPLHGIVTEKRLYRFPVS